MAVAPNPKVLEWAIKRSGFTVASLKKTWPKIEQWLDGSHLPTLKQIEDFSKKIHVNLNLLFADETPDLGLQIADFRTVAARRHEPSPELYDTINQMLFRQDWMRDYFKSEEYDTVDLVGMLDTSESKADIAPVAESIRNYFALSQEWAVRESDVSSAFRKFRDAVESRHISVVVNGIVGDNTHRALDVGEFRGFVLSDEIAPLIFINGADAKSAQMFTLAHELVHLALAKTGVISPDVEIEASSKTERLCDAVAAEMLVPQESFLRRWQLEADNYRQIKSMAARFKVSFMVCNRKARELGLISETDFFDFRAQHASEVSAVQVTRQPGGNFYATKRYRLGNVFGDAVFVAVQTRRLTYSEAFRLTGLSAKTFSEYFGGATA